MRDRQQRAAYLLYSAPVIGARSGHVAFIVTKPEFSLTADNFASFANCDVEYYCSMYPNPRPSLVKKLVKSMSSKSLEMITINSYRTDVLMRGLCRDRFNKRIKNDKTTVEHIEEVEALDEEAKDQFFRLGQFSSAIKLPASFDIDEAIASLGGIHQNKQWTAFAPAVNFVAQKPEEAAAHNCTSALVQAFKAGGIDVTQKYALTDANALQRVMFWCVYSTVALFCADDMLSNEMNLDKLLIIPLMYAVFRWAMAMNNAKAYYHDMRQMHATPDQLPIKLKASLHAGLFTINSLGCLHTPNAASTLFQFPVHLYQRLIAQEGTEVIVAKPVRDHLEKDELNTPEYTRACSSAR